MLGNNPRCGGAAPPGLGGRWCPGLPGLWWCQVETFWRPHLSLCAFLSFWNRIRAALLLEGSYPLPLKLLLLLGSHTDGPLQEPLGSGQAPPRPLSTSVHAPLSQSGADRDHRASPGGFVLITYFQNVGCNGTSLSSEEGAGAGIVSLVETRR